MTILTATRPADVPAQHNQLGTSWAALSRRLHQVRTLRPDAMMPAPATPFLPADADPLLIPEAVAELAAEHAAGAALYYIAGHTCTTAFAAARTGVQAPAAPTSRGVAVFAVPYRLDGGVAMRGIQWGTVTGGWWVVPLGSAGDLGMKPERALAPLNLGSFLPGTGAVDALDETLVLTAALWRLIESPTSTSRVTKVKREQVLVVNHAA